MFKETNYSIYKQLTNTLEKVYRILITKVFCDFNQPTPARIAFFRLNVLSVLLSSIFTPMAIWAQSVSGYEQNALAGATAALSAPAFSLSKNPAGLDGGFVSWYGFRHFGLSDLEETGVFISVPLQKKMPRQGYISGLAIEFHHFGFHLYRETRALAGIGIKTGNFKLGFAPGLRHTAIPEYGSVSEAYLNAGFLNRFSDTWQIGGYVNEVGLLQRGRLEAHGRSSVGVGLIYTFEGRLDWLLAGNQETGFHPSLATALRLWLLDNPLFGSFWISAGYTTMNDSWSCGLQYRYRIISAGFTLLQHPQLGRSHGLGFDTFWNKGYEL
jgi:hypothetical protein